jgi:hypothetical protein
MCCEIGYDECNYAANEAAKERWSKISEPSATFFFPVPQVIDLMPEQCGLFLGFPTKCSQIIGGLFLNCVYTRNFLAKILDLLVQDSEQAYQFVNLLTV